MIRQGLIYRSAGLNANSPDFNWDRTKWKKERIEDFRIGETKLSPVGVAYINDVLHWKTDLDLRSPGEVATMKESPAGPAVNWEHHSSLSYGGIFGQNGNCTGEGPEAMARNFRLFCDRANYPIEFHCIAGADRTGALAYVLNGVLGVKADDLEKDWEITANSYFKYEKMFDSLAGGFDQFGAPGDPLHKKIEAYLQKIGVTPEEIASFARSCWSRSWNGASAKLDKSYHLPPPSTFGQNIFKNLIAYRELHGSRCLIIGHQILGLKFQYMAWNISH